MRLSVFPTTAGFDPEAVNNVGQVLISNDDGSTSVYTNGTFARITDPNGPPTTSNQANIAQDLNNSVEK